MNDVGPIYGVELIDVLPLSGGMNQAMPSRDDLEGVQNYRQGTRVVAGYEVLLHHFRQLRSFAELCANDRDDCVSPGMKEKARAVLPVVESIFGASRN